jgi:hypothetical protein
MSAASIFHPWGLLNVSSKVVLPSTNCTYQALFLGFYKSVWVTPTDASGQHLISGKTFNKFNIHFQTYINMLVSFAVRMNSFYFISLSVSEGRCYLFSG